MTWAVTALTARRFPLFHSAGFSETSFTGLNTRGFIFGASNASNVHDRKLAEENDSCACGSVPHLPTFAELRAILRQIMEGVLLATTYHTRPTCSWHPWHHRVSPQALGVQRIVGTTYVEGQSIGLLPWE